MKKALALIIEDTEIVADYFALALEAAGYETEIIGDGQLAQERLSRVVPDIVLLDLHLPRLSGEEILAQIHHDPRLQRTRILIATANGTQASQISGDADLVLQKPIEYHQLRILSGKLHPDYKPDASFNEA